MIAFDKANTEGPKSNVYLDFLSLPKSLVYKEYLGLSVV